MSSDEREDFDVTEDDYLAAFGNRKFKKQSKNSRIYGIWADEEETGSDERASFSSGRKNTKKDYTAPGKQHYIITVGLGLKVTLFGT